MRVLAVTSPTSTGNSDASAKKISPKRILRKLRQKELNGKDLLLEVQGLNITKLEALSAYLGLEKATTKKATADAVAVKTSSACKISSVDIFLRKH